MSWNTYHTLLLLSDENSFFPPKLLVLAVVRQAVFSHVANNIRDMIITIRNVHMKIPEDYNARW